MIKFDYFDYFRYSSDVNKKNGTKLEVKIKEEIMTTTFDFRKLMIPFYSLHLKIIIMTFYSSGRSYY